MDTRHTEATFLKGNGNPPAGLIAARSGHASTPRPGAPSIPVTIIGAGPFGLSVAAYLRHYGLDFRIIGSPLSFWLNHMPAGMQLKSTGFSSTLYDPEHRFTIRHYCEQHGIPFEDVGLPVRIETFTAYALAFQKAMVPNVEEKKLVRLSRAPAGFHLELDDGSTFTSAHVVIGVGLDYFRNTPAELASLPRALLTHSADHHDLTRFRDKDVAVIGGGSSAIDLAVLLHEAGARATLVARKPELEFGLDEPLDRPLIQKLHRPMSGIGPGWKNRACTDLPWAFRYLPDQIRVSTVREFLGPAAGWFMKTRAEPVAKLLGHEVLYAREANGRLELRLGARDGSSRALVVDHAIAATGYRQDVRLLPFLDAEVTAGLDTLAGTPRLSSNFESSVPGLYFIGPIAANTFGPVMRFSIGAGFTSRRLSRHLAHVAPSPQRSLST